MKLKILEEVNSKEWDERVCSVGGSIFHSSVWADFVKAQSPYESPRFIVFDSEQGNLLGVALGFEQRSRHRCLVPFSRVWWFDAPPATLNRDESGLEESLRLIEEQAKASRAVSLRMGSFASQDLSLQLHKLGFSTTGRMEFEIRLTLPEEELWHMLGERRRNKIRKAIRNGVVIHELPGDEGLLEYNRLRAGTLERIRAKDGSFCERRSNGPVDPLQVLLDSGYGRIVCASLSGRVISALVFTHFNGLVYYHLAATDPIAYKINAPLLLLWESIGIYKSEGAKIFNLGGVKAAAVQKGSPEHGLYLFKSKFPSTCRACADGEKIISNSLNGVMKFAKSMESCLAHPFKNVSSRIRPIAGSA